MRCGGGRLLFRLKGAGKSVKRLCSVWEPYSRGSEWSERTRRWNGRRALGMHEGERGVRGRVEMESREYCAHALRHGNYGCSCSSSGLSSYSAVVIYVHVAMRFMNVALS